MNKKDKRALRFLQSLIVLLVGLACMTIAVYADVDLLEFEEEFDIQRYQMPRAAPEFKALDLDQTAFKLQDYRNKYIMLNFWASWCVPCVRELPELERLRQALPEAQFEIVAINVRDRESRLRKFLASRPYGFDIPLDRTGEIYKAYEVSSFPTTFLIDRQGRLYGRINGARYWMQEGFVEYMQQLIEKE